MSTIERFHCFDQFLPHVKPQEITAELVQEAFGSSPHVSQSLKEQFTEKSMSEKGALLLVRVFFHIVSSSFLDPSQTSHKNCPQNATSQNVMVVGVVKLLRTLLSIGAWGELVLGVLRDALKGCEGCVEGWGKEIEKGAVLRKEEAKKAWDLEEARAGELEEEVHGECKKEFLRLQKLVFGEAYEEFVDFPLPDIGEIFKSRKYVVPEKANDQPNKEKEEANQPPSGEKKVNQASAEKEEVNQPPSGEKEEKKKGVWETSLQKTVSSSSLTTSCSSSPVFLLNSLEDFKKKFISLCFFIRTKAILRSRQRFFEAQSTEPPPSPFVHLPGAAPQIASFPLF